MTFPWFPQTPFPGDFPFVFDSWMVNPSVPCSKSHGPSHWGPPLRAMWHPGKVSDFAISNISKHTMFALERNNFHKKIGWFSLLYIQFNLYIYNYPLASKVHFQTISPIESIARSICHHGVLKSNRSYGSVGGSETPKTWEILTSICYGYLESLGSFFGSKLFENKSQGYTCPKWESLLRVGRIWPLRIRMYPTTMLDMARAQKYGEGSMNLRLQWKRSPFLGRLPLRNKHVDLLPSAMHQFLLFCLFAWLLFFIVHRCS